MLILQQLIWELASSTLLWWKEGIGNLLASEGFCCVSDAYKQKLIKLCIDEEEEAVMVRSIVICHFLHETEMFRQS